MGKMLTDGFKNNYKLLLKYNTMKNKLKNAFGNTLNEISGLLYQIDSLINKDYIHVNEYLSKSILVALAKERKRIDKEFDYRESQFDNN